MELFEITKYIENKVGTLYIRGGVPFRLESIDKYMNLTFVSLVNSKDGEESFTIAINISDTSEAKRLIELVPIYEVSTFK